MTVRVPAEAVAIETVPKTSAFVAVIKTTFGPVLVRDTAPVKLLVVPPSVIAAPPVVTVVVPPIVRTESPACATVPAPELEIVRLPPRVVIVPFMVTPFTAFKNTLRLALPLAMILPFKKMLSEAFSVNDWVTAEVIEILPVKTMMPVPPVPLAVLMVTLVPLFSEALI